MSKYTSFYRSFVSPDKTTNICHVSPGDLWAGESEKLNRDLAVLVCDLRDLAFLLVRAIGRRKRVSAYDKAAALCYVARCLRSTARKIEREYGESFNGLAEAGPNRKLGSSVLGADGGEDGGEE